MLEHMRLDGRSVMVTGASRGIGGAIAHALGEARTALAVVGCDEEGVDAVAQELEAIPAGYGKIVGVASKASCMIPDPQKQARYNASKAGLVQLVRSMGAEWSELSFRINCVFLCLIRTRLLESEVLRPLVREWSEQIPVGRFGEVADV